jgi:hypothetical protein
MKQKKPRYQKATGWMVANLLDLQLQGSVKLLNLQYREKGIY